MFSKEKPANHHSHTFYYFFKYVCFSPLKIFKTSDLKYLPLISAFTHSSSVRWKNLGSFQVFRLSSQPCQRVQHSTFLAICLTFSKLLYPPNVTHNFLSILPLPQLLLPPPAVTMFSNWGQWLLTYVPGEYLFALSKLCLKIAHQIKTSPSGRNFQKNARQF